MKAVLDGLWSSFVQPMLQRPARVQMAALCYRTGKAGKQILLITSRDTGRWIIPKGWPIVGKSSCETAMQEAWEEAGVKNGTAETDSIGSYTYEKHFDNGASATVETSVYPIAVETLADSFPEADERTRKWVSPEEAASLVDEPELKKLLEDFT
ncbi:MAG: NUDIX hydrolase [Boseongicola sp.]|nr:NUDIX hydrolase [Boseongicola sp.]